MMDHPVICYQESPVRKDWNHPTFEEMAKSLNKAHDVNRALVSTVDRLQHQLGLSRFKNVILVAILGGASAKGIEIAVLAILAVLKR